MTVMVIELFLLLIILVVIYFAISYLFSRLSLLTVVGIFLLFLGLIIVLPFLLVPGAKAPTAVATEPSNTN